MIVGNNNTSDTNEEIILLISIASIPQCITKIKNRFKVRFVTMLRILNSENFFAFLFSLNVKNGIDVFESKKMIAADA